jgi:hypothetical protein
MFTTRCSHARAAASGSCDVLSPAHTHAASAEEHANDDGPILALAIVALLLALGACVLAAVALCKLSRAHSERAPEVVLARRVGNGTATKDDTDAVAREEGL